ncbi:DUF6498-containing protein [Jejudonia soesokkakensis]|uniref:DUF6498-containing protein n=1 Tax=Jejudonia soesokkakensis TaxID=1323432 RepID=A0ABW2MSP3_9FLAO
MIKNLLFPNKYNILVWANTLFLLVLLLSGYASAITIVLAYFMETIIIGLFHILKLWIVVKKGKPGDPTKNDGMSGMGVIPFFIVHYGMFVAIQSIFVFSFFAHDFPEIKEAFHLIDNYTFALQLDGMHAIIASLVVTNLGYFYTNFLATEKYKEYTPAQLFFKPYVRIFIQQFAVILAGFFFIILSQGIAAAILLLIIRLPVDLIMVGIHKDSKPFEAYVKKHSTTYNQYLETKKKYQEFSE